MSHRDNILARTGTPSNREPLNITAWGDGLYVREMNAAERDAWEVEQLDRSKAGKGLDNFRARLVVRVVEDEQGERVFRDSDADAVGKLPAREVRTAFDLASRLNALTPQDQQDLTKNS